MDDQYKARRKYSTTLIIIGLLILIYPLSTEALGAYSQYRLQTEWRKEIADQKARSKLAESRQQASLDQDTISNENTVLTRAAANSGNLINKRNFPSTKIRIPKINLEQVVVEGVGENELRNGPGHYPGTAFPGDKGNIGIAGHRVTFTHPFNRVDELHEGDEIVLETLSYIFTYKVQYSKTLDPSDVTMLTPSREPALTLTTCAPKYSARYRLDVRAVLTKTIPRQQPTILKRLIANVRSKKQPEAPKTLIDAAIAESRERLKQNPNNLEAHIQLGIAYQSLKKFDKAEAEYRISSRLDPRSPQPFYRLGLLFEAGNDYEKAIDNFNRALALDPTDDNVLFRLGDLYLKSDQYDRAISLFQNGLRSSPFSADFHYNLARAYEKSGRDKEAISHYQEAIRFVPDYDEAKAGLKRILK